MWSSSIRTPRRSHVPSRGQAFYTPPPGRLWPDPGSSHALYRCSYVERLLLFTTGVWENPRTRCGRTSFKDLRDFWTPPSPTASPCFPPDQVCMHVPLPDAHGRRQILGIHLRQARGAGLVSPAVDDAFLSEETEGFSGADIAGLVRSAISFAIADWRASSSPGPGAREGARTGVGGVDGEGKGAATASTGRSDPRTGLDFIFRVPEELVEQREGDEDESRGEEDAAEEEGGASAGRKGEEASGAGEELRVSLEHFEMALREVRPSVRTSFSRRLRERVSKAVGGARRALG